LTLRDKPVNLNDIPTKRGKRVSGKGRMSSAFSFLLPSCSSLCGP
jgi:hypothetical protein